MLPFLDPAVPLAGATLVVAAVSAGNVGQLAVDLVVPALRMRGIGSLESRHVYPAAGVADDRDAIATNLDGQS